MAEKLKYDSLFSFTIESRSKQLADNMSQNNALISRLKEKGKIKPISGGTKILEELEYGEGDAFWYSGYDTIDYAEKQLFTAAEYQIKLCAVPVAVSGEDMLKNSGKEQIMDLFEKRVDNACKTIVNQMGRAVYSDGTGSDGKEIGGLRLLVADSPSTGTVGGIDRSVAGNEFWRNKAKTTALTGENILSEMNKMYLSLSRGADKPDLIVADETLYSLYENALQPHQRFTNPKTAEGGFMNLKFKGADVIFDGGQGGNCPENHMYFLNTNYIYLRPHKDRNMTVVGGERMAVNQDAYYKIIGWAGNMTMSNAALQGVLING